MTFIMLKAATSLDDAYKTLSTEPLVTPEGFQAFYREQLNQVRGGDRIERLALGLDRAYAASHYKAFLMGHPGVGKSTELTRLIQQVTGNYRALRFSVLNELDPASFKPFDVLLLMMAEVAEKTDRSIEDGGAGQRPSDERLREIWDWFATEETTRTQATNKAAEVAAGIGVPEDSWWAKVVGLFATVKGEMKYAAERKTEIHEKRLDRINTLIELANRLLDECNALLRREVNREWLFIGEDFDKPGIPVAQIEGLFLTYANVFKNLRAHLIFTIPIALGYSHQAGFLPFPEDRRFYIPDTPVFDADHKPHEAGRNAIRSVLEARVSPDLFEEKQMMRLIVASGGNLRDLFSMSSQAADSALLRKSPNGKINSADVDSTIGTMRTEYTRRLGDSPYDKDTIVYEDKANRLVQIYNSDPNAEITDQVLYFLLRSRAIQEFDGERWFGVHPLVVDVLKSQGRIRRDLPGGTE